MHQEDADLTLTSTQLDVGGVVSVLSGFELAELTGGARANTIDASAFTGLNNGTPLSFLNNGVGVGVTTDPAQADLRITLTDGSTTVDVNLSSAVTLGDVFTAIATASSNRLLAAINSAGTGLELTDTTDESLTLQVQSLNSSTAVSDLGLDTVASGASLVGSAIQVPGVTLEGGFYVDLTETVVVSELNNGTGISTNDVEFLDLRDAGSSTPLSSLRNGDGIGSTSDPADDDFSITLSDGITTVAINISTATTVQGCSGPHQRR